MRSCQGTFYSDEKGTKKIGVDSRLLRDAGRKVYLILDNLKAHHGKKVAEWLETLK